MRLRDSGHFCGSWLLGGLGLAAAFMMELLKGWIFFLFFFFLVFFFLLFLGFS